jgi:arylsulfatase A-like enzyme
VGALGHFVDVVPTLAAVTDALLPDRELDGHDLGPRLAEGDEHPDDRQLFARYTAETNPSATGTAQSSRRGTSSLTVKKSTTSNPIPASSAPSPGINATA